MTMFLKEDDGRVPACAPAKKERLADNLSGLLRQAVRDAQIAERTPGYVLDMSQWVADGPDGCHVCMAGAVFRMTCGGGDSFEKEWQEVGGKMSAINAMRVGCLVAAYAGAYGRDATPETMATLDAVSKNMRGIFSFRDQEDRYDWAAYLWLADQLEALGL